MSLPEGTWTYDPSHYPDPLSPLSADVWFAAMGRGIRAAARELRAPFGGFDTTTFAGGWAYERELEPDWESDAEVFEGAALAVAGRWRSEYLDRTHAITGELRTLRPERSDSAGAAGELDRLVALVDEQWVLHFLTIIPVHAARELLHDAYVRLLGKGDELEPYRLLEGLTNETLAADELLWGVARLAVELDVADLIVELPSVQVSAALRASHHGRRVLAALDVYLERYGGRSRLHELSEPRQAERPELALEAVRLFIEHPRDLPAERARREREREELVSMTLGRISVSERAGFARLLEQVAEAVELEETHAYHIDYPGLAATREALLGFGARLVTEGRLERREDVFDLRLEELRAAVRDGWGRPLHALVAERQAERARAFDAVPVPVLGPPPDPDAPIPPMLAKFYGVPGSASASADGELIRGTGASSGTVTGVARVVRGADFAEVSAGEILVCTTTTPAWTPLFASLAGLVTDTGGILCHAAVVAREYGLPAVVGTEVATRRVRDGALVRIDGDTGEVHLLRDER